jgi:hypothetical protein
MVIHSLKLELSAGANGCAQPDFPGVYSRVSGQIDWIKTQICTLSDFPPDYCNAGSVGPVAVTAGPISSPPITGGITAAPVSVAPVLPTSVSPHSSNFSYCTTFSPQLRRLLLAPVAPPSTAPTSPTAPVASPTATDFSYCYRSSAQRFQLRLFQLLHRRFQLFDSSRCSTHSSICSSFAT